MSYYFEVWLRGYAKDYIRSLSSFDEENFHPHITLARPFDKIKTSEEKIIKKVARLCSDKEPIPFTLKGKGDFYHEGNKINSPKITNSEKLLQFHHDLEEILKNDVEFYKKIEEEKKLHVTTDMNKEIVYGEEVEQYMLRLTGIKNEKIWFSYDIVTKNILSRDESLDKTKWYQTVHKFSKKYKKLPTRQGFANIK